MSTLGGIGMVVPGRPIIIAVEMTDIIVRVVVEISITMITMIGMMTDTIGLAAKTVVIPSYMTPSRSEERKPPY